MSVSGSAAPPALPLGGRGPLGLPRLRAVPPRSGRGCPTALRTSA